MCRVECKRGLAEVAGLTNGVPLPPAGIFNPPFAINVGLNQQSILTKVYDPILHHPSLLETIVWVHHGDTGNVTAESL